MSYQTKTYLKMSACKKLQNKSFTFVSLKRFDELHSVSFTLVRRFCLPLNRETISKTIPRSFIIQLSIQQFRFI